MRAHRVLRNLVAVATVSTPLWAIACSGDDSLRLPDAGDAAAVTAEAGGASDATQPADAGVEAETTTCTSDGAAPTNCNACAAPATDPYNACSSYTGGCIPFDASRVPAHPSL